MDIPVNTPNLSKKLIFKISFDEYGNLYFDGTHCNKLLYQINISGRNHPFAEPGNYAIKQKTNKKKIGVFTIIQPKEEEEGKELEEDDGEDEYNGDLTPDYYPEEAGYVMNSQQFEDELDDDDIIAAYGANNKKLIFSNDGEFVIPIYDREDGEVTALYDSYLYHNNKLCFKSNSADETSIYRFNLHSDGNIFFRPVGQREAHFTLYVGDDNNLIFVLKST